MKLIAITGSPGTGKSTLAKILEKKLKLERLELHQYYKEISTGYDRKKQCYDIDMKKFKLLVKEKIKLLKKQDGNCLIIDSHISHLLPKVDLCVVMVCLNLKKLEKRLIKRKYSKKKIRENLDSEIFQICLNEASEKHEVLVVDSSKKINQTELLNKITKLIKN